MNSKLFYTNKRENVKTSLLKFNSLKIFTILFVILLMLIEHQLNAQITGTVYNDLDGSANGTFTGIQSGAEIGTNANGTLRITAVNASTNQVVSSAAVSVNGTYTLSYSPNAFQVYLIIDTIAWSVGTLFDPNDISGNFNNVRLPAGWSNTTPLVTLNVNYNTTGNNFGIQQNGYLPISTFNECGNSDSLFSWYFVPVSSTTLTSGVPMVLNSQTSAKVPFLKMHASIVATGPFPASNQPIVLGYPNNYTVAADGGQEPMPKQYPNSMLELSGIGDNVNYRNYNSYITVGISFKNANGDKMYLQKLSTAVFDNDTYESYQAIGYNNGVEVKPNIYLGNVINDNLRNRQRSFYTGNRAWIFGTNTGYLPGGSNEDPGFAAYADYNYNASGIIEFPAPVDSVWLRRLNEPTWERNYDEAAIGTSEIAGFRYCPVTIAGNLWNDANGNGLIDGIESNILNSGYYINLLDEYGNVLESVAIQANGSYTFANVPQLATSVPMKLQISNAQGIIGSAPPAMSIPNGYVSVSENQGGMNPELLALANMEIALPLLLSTSLTNYNFGIEQAPTANVVTAPLQVNPGGSNTVIVPDLGGTDPEDGVLGSGNIITITTLPTDGVLYYDNMPVIVGQVIANYNPALLTVDPNPGGVTVTFTYTVTDSAGLPDLSPALVGIPFFVATLPVCSNTGVLLDDWNSTISSSLILTGTNSILSTTAGVGIVEGERDLRMTINSNAINNYSNGIDVIAGAFTASTGSGVGITELTLIYDGIDGAAAGVNTSPGLGDMNMNGTDSFKTTLNLDGMGIGKYTTVTFRVYSDATHWSDANVTYYGPVSNPTYNIAIPQSAFVQGIGAAGIADFTSVNAVQMSLTSNQNGLDVTFSNGITVPCAGYSITGNVFNDVNANTVIDVSENGTTANSNLFVYLVNSSNVIVDSAQVLPNGTYTLHADQTEVYTIELSAQQYTIGTNVISTPIDNSMPAGWVTTGENGTNNNGIGDGNPDGVIFVTVGTSDIDNQNFGIQQPPTAVNSTLPSQINPGGSTGVIIPSNYFDGNDQGGGTVDSLTITIFPTNVTSITINGITYTIGTFPVGGVTIATDVNGNPVLPIAIDPVDGNITAVITYTVIDNGGAISTPATVSVPFTNDVPVANLNAVSTLEGTPITIPVITNDNFGNDGPSINTISITNQPPNGVATVNDGGTPNDPTDDQIVYIPNPGFYGNDTLIYQICDFNGDCDTALTIITVDPNIDANPDINQTLVNTPVSGTVATNDNVIPGSTFTPIGTMSNGTLVMNPNGTYTYTPNPGFVGTDSISYVVCSPAPVNLCDTTTLTIVVTPIYSNSGNTVIAQDDHATTPLNTAVIMCLLCNDSDPNGNTIGNPTVISNPTNGIVVVNPNGTVTYTPDAGFTGNDVYQYIICDNGVPVACDTAYAYVTIVDNPIINNQTYANDDAYTTPVNTPINNSVAGNDTDPQNDAVTFTLVTNPTNGTLTLNSDGTFTYTPNPGYTGPDQFVYSKCDNGNPVACDTATAYITIVDIYLSLAGNIFDDVNGLGDSTVNGAGTEAGGLNAILVDASTGIVVAIVPVAIDGTYLFEGIAAGTYDVMITSSIATVGNVAPGVVLPPNWVNTGENIGTGVGNDGAVNGIIANIVLDTASVYNVNFGIEQLPNSNNVTQTIPSPAINIISAGTVTNPIAGSDPEEGILGNMNTVIITTLPSNATMYYNGILVTIGQIIQGFNPALISYTDIALASNSIQFEYAFIDSAGMQDPTPATYTINWAVPLPIYDIVFNVVENKCSADLQWSVSKEENFSHYEIERSFNASAFIKIADVTSSNEPAEKHYNYKDQELEEGDYTYRLKVVDIDNTFGYTTTKSVSLRCIEDGISVFPNPTSDMLHVNIKSTEATYYLIRIYDAVGKLILSSEAELNENEYKQITFSLAQLSNGTYHIHVISEGSKQVYKVLKQ